MTVAGVIAAALVAGALGTLLRWGLTRLAAAPGLLLANLTAAFLAGAAMALVTPLFGPIDPHRDDAPHVLLAGIGGFTLGLGTFSTVAVDAAEAAVEGEPRTAARIWAAHLLGGLVTAALGFAVGSSLF